MTSQQQQRAALAPRKQHEELLHEEVLVTPGGHRAHKLRRTSPGGTAHVAQYRSPPGVLHFMDHYEEEREEAGFPQYPKSKRSLALEQVGAAEYGFFGVCGVARVGVPHPCKGRKRKM